MMAGFDHNFTEFDAALPYEFQKSGAVGSLGTKTNCAIIDKATGRSVYTFDRAYGGYGKATFAPFIWEGKWLAFIGTQYNNAKIIDLSDGREVSVLDREKTGGHFCPTSIYVPCFHIDTESYYHSEEIHWKSFTKDGYRTTISSANKDYDKYEGDVRTIPAHDNFWVTPDHQMSDPTEKVDIALDGLHFLNTALISGVWWAADYDWEVYTTNIPDAIRTGKFAPDRHIFEFDRSNHPDVRQFVRAEEQEVTSLKAFDPDCLKFKVYQVSFLDLAAKKTEAEAA